MNPLSSMPDLGDLVFASNSEDMSWNEPWTIGRVTAKSTSQGCQIEGDGWWPYCVVVSPSKAEVVTRFFPNLKGKPFHPKTAESLFAKPDRQWEAEIESPQPTIEVGDFAFVCDIADKGDLAGSWGVNRVTEKTDMGIRIKGCSQLWLFAQPVSKEVANAMNTTYKTMEWYEVDPQLRKEFVEGRLYYTGPEAGLAEPLIDIDGMTVAQRLELIEQLNQANDREARSTFEERAAIVSSWFNTIDDFRNFYTEYADWVKA